MSRTSVSSKIGDFRVESYGSGEPTIMAIGGLAYAPSDFSRLADHTEGTLHVVNNPVHAGAVKRTDDWQQNLREGYANVFRTLQPQYLLGHSCGSFDGVHMLDQLEGLKGLVMLAPPYGKAAMSDSSRREEFGLLDRCLSTLCTDMPDDLYMSILEAHTREYGPRIKDIFRNEVPRTDIVRDINERLLKARSRILIVLGKLDPWNNAERAPFAAGGDFSIASMDTSHYPHVTKPEETAEIIRQWFLTAI